ncbi:hypothetical protein WN48_05087 [Eufriesea mexicana]|nr:hypothetical protein WN48_05087 [Eufriesea mexicana]
MLACVYPAENFKSKAVTVKLRHGRSKRKPKLLSVKEKPADTGKQPECNDTPKLENETFLPEKPPPLYILALSTARLPIPDHFTGSAGLTLSLQRRNRVFRLDVTGIFLLFKEYKRSDHRRPPWRHGRCLTGHIWGLRAEDSSRGIINSGIGLDLGI